MASCFIFESGDDAFGAGVDDIPRGGKSKPPIDAKGNPAWLVTQLDTHFLLWRRDGRVKDVNAAVGAVVEPQFLFVGCKSDAVAGATVPLGGTFLKARHFNAVQHFSCFVVSNFKPEQIVDVDKTKGLAAIDGEGANGIAERATASRGDRRGSRRGHKWYCARPCRE